MGLVLGEFVIPACMMRGSRWFCYFSMHGVGVGKRQDVAELIVQSGLQVFMLV